MAIDDKIRDEKVHDDINGEAANISALSSGKIDKFLTGEEALSSDQSRIIEQAKFTYSPLGKAFEKQIKKMKIKEKNKKQKQKKTLEDHGKQLVKSSSEKESLTLLKQK